MSALMKDDARLETRPVNRFPPEVFHAHDDVTPEAVQKMRDRAKEQIASKKWTKIDGVGKREAI